MSYMFDGCSSLILLPDISKWNTNNVTDMSKMFYNCLSLKSLPDISKWNTYNMKYINGIFSYCKSLLSLPDISKWNTNEVTEMRSVFSGCESLISLPDISKWNTKNVYGMSDIFSHCKSLKSLPDISKWDYSNVSCVKDIFSEYYNKINLPILPDIKLHLFKGYMYENQFTKFLDILKNLLNKKEKTENKFEIKTSIKDLDGINLRVASLKNIDFEKTFEISPKEKNFKWISTLKFEIKNENKDFYAEWQKWKALIDGYIYKYNDKYELELRQNGKNLYFDFISKNNDAFKRILDCLLDIVEFDITLKSGIDTILLLNENLSDENIIDKICSLLITFKTSINIHHILNSLFRAFKEVKFNNNNLQEFNDFIIGYLENKNCVEIIDFIFEKEIENLRKDFGEKFCEEFAKRFGEEFDEKLGEEFKEKIKNKIREKIRENLKK